MSSLLVSGQLPDLAKETPVWLAAGEASSKAAVTAATWVRGAEYPVAHRGPVSGENGRWSAASCRWGFRPGRRSRSGKAHMTINDAAAYEQLRAELPALYRTGG